MRSQSLSRMLMETVVMSGMCIFFYALFMFDEMSQWLDCHTQKLFG